MNFLNNDTGFFQKGKSFGGKGISGMLGDVRKNFMDKPYAGIPGVCPYTGKPLKSKEEQATGVSKEAMGGMGNGMFSQFSQANTMQAPDQLNPLIQRRFM